MTKLLSIALLISLISGCKIDSKTPKEIGGFHKVCNLVGIIAPDLKLHFNLINKDFKSDKLFIDGVEIDKNCKYPYNNGCAYGVTTKLNDTTLSYEITNSSYQKKSEVNVKLILLYPDDTVAIIERLNEVLDWTKEETPENCSFIRYSDIDINQ